ncbi:hypothetical protein FQN60_012168, partial [Etheostoma spectabile]
MENKGEKKEKDEELEARLNASDLEGKSKCMEPLQKERKVELEARLNANDLDGTGVEQLQNDSKEFESRLESSESIEKERAARLGHTKMEVEALKTGLPHLAEAPFPQHSQEGEVAEFDMVQAV